MKLTALALLALTTSLAFGQNYSWGHINRNGYYYNMDTGGNYNFGRVDPQTGNYYNFDLNRGSYNFGHIWQDPD